ncbi:acetolactate decarboxylase [Thiocystis violacea]|uniref:acetolactate decarboxylase n=1 Tax=Thiocystis violacea TaxID=13725 RepID=UPI0019045E06|nr:acetolactate decarboxylase [Thiocystis violacea]MBK1717057.1 acetolactate decarboxylase [Thiocystis violacea]
MPRTWFLLALIIAGSVQADNDREILYQVSTIDALLTGVYQPLAKLREVRTRGDFGLGTFDALDGELILLEGQVYQAAADGQVRLMPPDTGTPFMAVTFFDADHALDSPADQPYADFKTWLESRLPSHNLIYAVRVDGVFDHILFRSVPRQNPPYRPLAEVSRQQTLFEQSAIRGTLIGFWCPTFLQGVNVPGFHLHFLSADRRHAGHVLDFRLAQGRVQLDQTDGWEVQLPLHPAFLDAPLHGDQSRDLQAVEQGHSTP